MPDWGQDLQGRDNHSRVAHINTVLKAKGYITWFEYVAVDSVDLSSCDKAMIDSRCLSENHSEERMRGNINEQMANGIDSSKIVIVFVTQRYLKKVAGEGDLGGDDNCV